METMEHTSVKTNEIYMIDIILKLYFQLFKKQDYHLSSSDDNCFPGILHFAFCISTFSQLSLSINLQSNSIEEKSSEDL